MNIPAIEAPSHKRKDEIWGTRYFVDAAMRKHLPLNMGRGFPNFAPPLVLREALQRAAISDRFDLHQYTAPFGLPRLVNALSKLYSPLYGREIDPSKEILVTLGGTGSLYTAVKSLLKPGDEVIILEPYFDYYELISFSTGVIPVYVPLRPPSSSNMHSSKEWTISKEDFKNKITPKTKMLLINSPHNPTGKVFTLEELQIIADICVENNLICLSDDVYEWMVYSPAKHVKIATLPSMWERTVTVGSVGKTFTATGWRLGWSIGPAHLISPMQYAHMDITCFCPTPLQEAAAEAFEVEMKRMNTPESSWTQLSDELTRKRDIIVKEFEDAGLHPVIPDGTYFMLIDISQVDFPEDDEEYKHPSRDVRCSVWMSKIKKLCGLPASIYFSDSDPSVKERFIRLCFIQDDKTIEKCVELIRQWR